MADDTDDGGADEGQEESGVIKTLRARERELEKQLKARPDRATLEAEIRAQLALEEAAGAVLTSLGYPAGLSKAMLEQVGIEEFDPKNAEQAAAQAASFLQSLGFEVTETAETSDDESGDDSSAQKLAEVANLGGKVASASKGTTEQSAAAQIAAAKNPEELAAVMAKLKLTHSYT
jgi:hypothetical protein